MKNFLEAQDIKPGLTLDCCLGVKHIHGNIDCVITVNGEIKTNVEREVWFSVPLDQPIDISIQPINRQHPAALELSLTIDGFEVLPKYQHLANPPTDYIDFNEIWSLQIPNFYSWYHEITGQGWIA